MKKDIYDYYKISVPKPLVMNSFEQEVVESSDSASAILQAVYALDPVTKLPTGDIMCYLCSTTPPEIKQFVIDNLMFDTSSHKLPPLPDGIDDDTAFALQRSPEENVDSYRSRINKYMQQQVTIRNMAIENAKRVSSSESVE